jgi:signal transduction histidine kinase
VAPALVEIAVRDRGVGVAPEHRDRIFERYFQAHETRTGMGLGLYISRAIVERHGGTIRAEFPDDGGSRFVVTLPA